MPPMDAVVPAFGSQGREPLTNDVPGYESRDRVPPMDDEFKRTTPRVPWSGILPKATCTHTHTIDNQDSTLTITRTPPNRSLTSHRTTHAMTIRTPNHSTTHLRMSQEAPLQNADPEPSAPPPSAAQPPLALSMHVLLFPAL